MLCAKFSWYCARGSGEEEFSFSLFRNNPPWKRIGSFIWTNLNSLHPGMLCVNFSWNWPCGSREDDKMWKVYRQTDGRWNTGDQKKLTWAFSSDELATDRNFLQTNIEKVSIKLESNHSRAILDLAWCPQTLLKFVSWNSKLVTNLSVRFIMNILMNYDFTAFWVYTLG